MLYYIILGFLMYGEMSGYDIKSFMAVSTAHFYEASFGSIYPMLNNLEKNEAITSREAVENGKYKKQYVLTEKGRGEFMEWLNQPMELSRTKHEHLVRIFFFGFLPHGKAAELLEDFAKRIEDYTEELKDVKRLVQGRADAFQMATLDFGFDYYAFLANWCRNYARGLQKK